MLEFIARFFEKISLIRFMMPSGISPNSSISSECLASFSMHSCCSVLGPRTVIPSRRLLSIFLRPLRTTGLAAFFSAFASFTISFPHGVQRSPPSGPALLYGVTVKRLLQISQFSSCPGSGLAFLYMSMTSSKSESSSEPFFFFFDAFLAALPFFIFAMASSWLRLRLRERSAAIAEDSACRSSSTSSPSSPAFDGPSPLSSASPASCSACRTRCWYESRISAAEMLFAWNSLISKYPLQVPSNMKFAPPLLR